MADKQDPVLLPFEKAVSLRAIDKLIDKALEKLREHYDTEPVGAEFETFVQDVYSLLPKVIRFDVVFASLMTLAGHTLTRDVIKQTAWRLAANLALLRKARPVPPWTRQTTFEWAAIKIVRAQFGRNDAGRAGYWYDYRVLSGTPAGLRFRLFWTTKYARFVANSVGFSRRKSAKGACRFTDGLEMVGMMMYFLLDPTISTEERPVNYHFYVPAACKTANRKILKQRIRIIPCPKELSLSDMQCFRCPFGYDVCPAGCHPFTHEIKPCPRCMASEAYFDKTGRSVICVDCEDDEVRSKE